MLDIDSRHGGDERLRDLEQRYGKLPDTVESLTGGGGRHVFFKHPGVPVRNDAGRKLGPGLDVRGDGGYAVLPPSQHASGCLYDWEASSHPDDVALAPMPPWLMARLTPPEGSRNGQPQTVGEPIPEGARNATLARLAGAMRRRGMTPREIHAALTVVNADRCTPPLSKDEVRRIAISIGHYDPATPEAAPTLQPVTATRLLAMEFPEPRWAIPELVIEGLTILAGRPKEGKSFMALGFCLAVAVGGRALGHIPVAQGEALYVGLEDSYRRLKVRMQDRLLEAKGRDPTAPDRLYLLTEFPRLDEGGVETLDAWLAEHPSCRLVVVDVLERIAPHRSGRNSHQYAQDYAMVAPLQCLALQRGVAIVLVHHTVKARYESVIDEVSGTTRLTAAADTIIVLTQIQGSAVLHVQGRDVARQELAVRFDPALGIWTLVGEAKEPVISPQRQAVLEVLRQAEGPMSRKDIGRALGRRDQKGMDALYVLLREMHKAGAIDAPARGVYAAKIAQHTQDAQVAQDAQDSLTVSGVLREAEAILSSVQGMAQDSAQNGSIEYNKENGHEKTILSDLSDLSPISSFTATDACPICGGREWRLNPRGTLICRQCLHRANRAGLWLGEWAELEDARWKREVETEVRRALGWYRTDCARCQRPLRDRTPDELLAGAELCAECDLPLQDLQWLRE